MCKPEYYEWIPNYNDPVNKVLSEGQTFDLEDAKKQHQELCDALSLNGVEILYVEPSKALRYQVYTKGKGI